MPSASSYTVPTVATANAAVSPALPSFLAIVDASDRSAEDRAMDKGRHPAELLKFLDLRPGMKVAEISAGGGYTTELLARAVAPNAWCSVRTPSSFWNASQKNPGVSAWQSLS